MEILLYWIRHTHTQKKNPYQTVHQITRPQVILQSECQIDAPCLQSETKVTIKLEDMISVSRATGRATTCPLTLTQQVFGKGWGGWGGSVLICKWHLAPSYYLTPGQVSGGHNKTSQVSETEPKTPKNWITTKAGEKQVETMTIH